MRVSAQTVLDAVPYAAEIVARRKTRPVLVPTFRGANLEAQTITAKEWISSGPYDCLAGETKIFDPLTGLTPTVAELEQAGAPVRVLTMGGPRFAEAPFVKGFAPLYRVAMRSGRSFVATGGHRILTNVGWTFVRDLVGGEVLPGCEPVLRTSSLGDAPLAHVLGALRSTERVRDSRDHYFEDSRLDDERPRFGEVSVRGAVPSRVDALGRICDSRSDDPVEESRRSHLGRASGRLSSWDFFLRAECLSTACAGSNVFERTPLPCDESFLSFAPPPRMSHRSQASRSASEGADNTLLFSLHSDEARPVSALLVPVRELSQSALRPSPHSRSLDRAAAPLLALQDLTSVGPSSSSQHYTVQADTVARITHLRDDWYYDLTVPGAAHFFAEGYWHHNTGKTVGCTWRLDSFARETPRGLFAIVRKVRADFNSSVRKRWEQTVRVRGGVMTRGGTSPSSYVYPNGAEVLVLGLDRDTSLLSGEFDGIYVNQAEELEISNWETLGSRVSGRGAVTKTPMLFGDCNPGSPGHWILERAKGRLRLLASTHKDNPELYDESGALTPVGAGRLEPLEAMTGVRRARFFEGKWVAAQGAVYDFDRAVHLITPSDLPFGASVC